MLDTVRQSLTLMWQGMGAIFLVIFVIYLLHCLLFPKSSRISNTLYIYQILCDYHR